jgi:hypothetical protein
MGNTHKIPVVRRLTGGEAFSTIQKLEFLVSDERGDEQSRSFERYTSRF